MIFLCHFSPCSKFWILAGSERKPDCVLGNLLGEGRIGDVLEELVQQCGSSTIHPSAPGAEEMNSHCFVRCSCRVSFWAKSTPFQPLVGPRKTEDWQYLIITFSPDLLEYENYTCENTNQLGKGGVTDLGAVKILALPKRGGSDLCQDFFGGFVEVSQKPYSGIT